MSEMFDAADVSLAIEAKEQEQKVRFKCTVIDDPHPNGVPLEQWGNAAKWQWIGITDEEMAACWAQSKGDIHLRLIPFARAIEAKLKEKNT